MSRMVLLIRRYWKGSDYGHYANTGFVRSSSPSKLKVKQSFTNIYVVEKGPNNHTLNIQQIYVPKHRKIHTQNKFNGN